MPALDIWVACKDFAKRHPEIVKAFAKSATDAQQPCVANPKIWPKQLGNIDRLVHLNDVSGADVPELVKGNTYLATIGQTRALDGSVDQAIIDTARPLKGQGRVPATGIDYCQCVTDRFVKWKRR